MKLLYRINNKFSELLNKIYVSYLRAFKGYKIGKSCFIDRKASMKGLYGSVSIGDNCIIEPNVRLKSNQNIEKRDVVIEIESGVFIGYGSIIDAACNIKIMQNSMIGPYVYITDSNHILKEKDIPIGLQGAVSKPTIIEKNVWVGSHCQILMGVRIGENSIVAANSTCIRSMKENSLITGIPAQVKKSIF